VILIEQRRLRTVQEKPMAMGEPIPIASVSARLDQIVDDIEREGPQAVPVLIERDGRTPAALISTELLMALADDIDALLSAPEIARRLQDHQAIPTSVDEIAALAGLTPPDQPDAGEGSGAGR
jgi:hypothetical protein